MAEHNEDERPRRTVAEVMAERREAREEKADRQSQAEAAFVEPKSLGWGW